MSIESIAEQYAACAASAVNYGAGWIIPGDSPNDPRIITNRSVRNIDTDASETFAQCHSVSSATSLILPLAPPFQVTYSTTMAHSFT